MLEGKTVNLKLVEKENLKSFTDFLNDSDMGSPYMPIIQQSETQIEERYEKLIQDEKWFFVEKKDGNRIGWISHSLIGGIVTIEYALIPSERKKGYGTEAIKIIVDYLFLAKNIVRVQAETLAENSASQKALEKAGFTREAIKRKSSFIRGLWRDDVLYSILREEWQEPKILKG